MSGIRPTTVSDHAVRRHESISLLLVVVSLSVGLYLITVAISASDLEKYVASSDLECLKNIASDLE